MIMLQVGLRFVVVFMKLSRWAIQIGFRQIGLSSMFVGHSLIRFVPVRILNVWEVVLKIVRWVPLLAVFLFLPAVSLDVLAAKLFDKSTKKKLTEYLDEICQWVVATDMGAGKSAKDSQDSFAVSGS